MNTPTTSQKCETCANLIKYIQQMHDCRMQSRIDYSLWKIVVISLCATLAGANNFVEIEQYGKERRRWLKQYFTIDAIPSHDTFNRVFGLINPKDFTNCMVNWLNSFMSRCNIINIDAKILEGYRSDDPFAILRAWSCETKNVLGQIKVPYGTNEITAIPMLLDTLDIKGKIITIDAIGAQKKIVKQIVEKDADYLIALKANQHAFYHDVKLFLDSIADGELSQVTFTRHETSDHDHGRTEKRCCWSTEDIFWLPQKHEWAGLKSIAIIKTTIERGNKITFNRRYFISSLVGNAEFTLYVVRQHWSIENQLHWHLDVTFNEDKSKVKGIFAAQNLSLIRATAVSALTSLPLATGLARKRQTVNRRPSFLKKIL